MSQENVEIVRRMWDAFLTGDIELALSFIDPGVEWDGSNLPDGPIGHGHDVILDHISRWAGQWDEWTVEVERAIDAGNEHVVVFIRERGQSKAGLKMNERHAELYSLQDGKVARRQGFSNPNEALAAVGLSE